MACVSDTVANEDGLELDYGKTLSLGGFSCTSEKTGMTCTNPAGHGFTIAKAKTENLLTAFDQKYLAFWAGLAMVGVDIEWRFKMTGLPNTSAFDLDRAHVLHPWANFGPFEAEGSLVITRGQGAKLWDARGAGILRRGGGDVVYQHRAWATRDGRGHCRTGRDGWRSRTPLSI